jgi:hypothetical protein
MPLTKVQTEMAGTGSVLQVVNATTSTITAATNGSSPTIVNRFMRWSTKL